MTFFGKILGYRDFAKLETIKMAISSKLQLTSGETLDKAGTLIFFKTQRQQTWLLVSNKNLYCILDDIQTDNAEIRWQMTKADLFDNSKNFKLKIKIISEYKEKSGLIDFGANHPNWLYSKDLYQSAEKLRTDIEELIKNHIN